MDQAHGSPPAEALAWEIQAKVHGGLSRRTSRKLAQPAAAKTTTREAQPGMRLVREWGGKLHIVTIGEDCAIRWNDWEWQSLSEIDRAITGTRWSARPFFGLKTRKAEEGSLRHLFRKSSDERLGQDSGALALTSHADPALQTSSAGESLVRNPVRR